MPAEQEIDIKEEMLEEKNSTITRLEAFQAYLQNQLYILRINFMPHEKVGLLAGLLPSGRKRKKAQMELDENERKHFIKKESVGD